MAADLKGKRVLVTGAGGFIGSHLAEALVGRGCRVKALVHYNATSHIANLRHVEKDVLAEMDIVFGDIQDGRFCDTLTEGTEIVFHLAALIGIPYSYVAPSSYVQTNIIGTVNLLNAALRNGVGHFLQTSTSEVYGTALYKPIDEKHPLQGQSPYSATKIGADKLVESFHRSFGLNATILRPFNTYGPRQSLRAVIPTIVTQALRSDRVKIGSTAPKRDLNYVLDTVEAYLLAAGRTDLAGETIHFGTGSFHSVGELIGIVGRILGKKLEAVQESERVRPERSEVMELLCDNTRARELLGWKPRRDIEQGLREVVEFFRERGEREPDRYHI